MLYENRDFPGIKLLSELVWVLSEELCNSGDMLWVLLADRKDHIWVSVGYKHAYKVGTFEHAQSVRTEYILTDVENCFQLLCDLERRYVI